MGQWFSFLNCPPLTSALPNRDDDDTSPFILQYYDNEDDDDEDECCLEPSQQKNQYWCERLEPWRKELQDQGVYYFTESWVVLPNRSKIFCQFLAYVSISGGGTGRPFAGKQNDGAKTRMVNADNFVDCVEWVYSEKAEAYDEYGFTYRKQLKHEMEVYGVV